MSERISGGSAAILVAASLAGGLFVKSQMERDTAALEAPAAVTATEAGPNQPVGPVQEIGRLGVSGIWCASDTIMLSTGEDITLCLDTDTASIESDYRIYIGMQSIPAQPTEVLVRELTSGPQLQECIASRDELNQLLMADVTRDLGQHSYTIDIHLDPENSTGPCDDPLPEE